MQFTESDLAGVFVIELQSNADDRGFFARSWCTDEFRDAGLSDQICQANISFNHKAGTLRGLHYQGEPSPETKVVRCTHGRIFDVVVDLRADSSTYCQWIGVELTQQNRKALYIPPECAHGFQTLEDNTEVHYLMSAKYNPDAAQGVLFDDPAFDITWPLPVTIIADKDRRWPFWRTSTDIGHGISKDEH